MVLNSSNQVDSKYNYSPFGRIMYSSVSTDVAYKFTSQEFDDENGLYNFRARMYDAELGMFYAYDPAMQGFSPYGYCGNSPAMYVDKDGRWFFSLFLGPVGAIIDAALWSATIDAGVQGLMMATGNQDKFNWAELGGAFIGGAIGGSMAYLAPAVNTYEGVSLGEKYISKALYAGLTGSVSAAGGLLTQDLLENGKIDYNYRNSIYFGFGFGSGISLATSIYDYVTWDRFSYQERVNILNQELNTNIQFDPNDLQNYGKIDNNQYYITAAGLESKTRALSNAAHELQHIADINAGITADNVDAIMTPMRQYSPYRQYMEFRAYMKQTLFRAAYWDLPARYLLEAARNLTVKYGYTGGIPNSLTITNLWFNLFR
jgi:RHS repeat-associated protein